jgi:RHS repeat-associated protein
MEKADGSTGTMYWYGPGGEVLTESGLGKNTINEEYVFFNGQRIARIDRPNGAVHYYFSDHLQSASVITDSSGNITAEDFYYPYGGLIASTGSDPNHYKFTGKERDSESNLDNFGARYFTSNIGRFMTPDWAARPTAVPYAAFGDPQSLNLYTYVRNDPVSRADADGHQEATIAPASGQWGDGDFDDFTDSRDVADQAGNTTNTSNKPGAQTQEKSPDPTLPINHKYVLAVENDSGVIEPEMDGRKVEYDLHNAPDAKNPNGTPVNADTSNSSVIYEHNSNKSLSEGHSGHGQFADNLGPGGNRKDTGTLSNDRYFTLTINNKQMGVIPIVDRFGTHIVDHIEVHMDAGHPENNYTVLNGHRGPTDVQ